MVRGFAVSTRINPYRLFVGSFLPNWLLCRTEIGLGAKVTYARLAQYAGENGVAFPKLETLAAELGSSVRQVQRYIAELEEAELVEVQQPGLGQPNRYSFLRHAWMSASVSIPDRTDLATPDRTDMSTLEASDMSTPTMKRISRRESVEESGTTPDKPAAKKRVLELRPTFMDEACAKYQQWDRDKVERLVDSAVNYYLPEMRRGKYQDINLCVWNNLADKAEKEGANGTQRTNTALSQFTRGAGSTPPAGRTEAERYAARVTRYQS